MGFLDLSTSVGSKKHVDFNDARYQLAEKLKQSGNKTARSTFTLYDDKDANKVSVDEIAAAYMLSDKRLSIGEILNKMLDLIIDMEDGTLNTEKDAVYAWKYSVQLLKIYEDKSKRHESFSAFDNGLKISVINSKTFIQKYPGKYTSRTNFFDTKVKNDLISDIASTFKDETLQGIHETAVQQSKEIAAKHQSPILDRIVQWATANYDCRVDSFYDVKEDAETHLYYSVNTIILHLKNGYDISIIGHVGTEHDDKFAISVFNASDISVAGHKENVTQDTVQNTLLNASSISPVDPLTKLLEVEKHKNSVLKQQYDILAAIRPMVPKEALDLQAAESVVGKDYLWGCKQFRETHEDLPRDFKLEDVKLPSFDEKKAETDQNTVKDRELLSAVKDITNLTNSDVNKQNAANNKPSAMIHDSVAPKAVNDENMSSNPVSQAKREANPQRQSTANENANPVLPTNGMNADELIRHADLPEDMFDVNTKTESKQHSGKKDYVMPVLNMNQSKVMVQPAQKKEETFDVAATLLPGVAPVKKKQEQNGPSVTNQAQPVPTLNAKSIWKDASVQKSDAKKETKEPTKEKVEQPDLLIDDIDSLFA